MKSHETSRLQLPTLHLDESVNLRMAWPWEMGRAGTWKCQSSPQGLCPSLLSTHTGLSFLEHLGLLPIIFPISGVLHQLSCLLSIFSSVPLFSPSFPLFLQPSDPNTFLMEPSVRRPSVNSHVTLNCSSEANFTVL